MTSQGNSWSRRNFLRAGVIGSVASSFARPAGAESSAQISVQEIRVISLQQQNYHGWPTVTRARGGELFLVCSGGREGHVCPFGRVELMTSRDNGGTWSWPRILLDSAIDDRDAGVTETARGTLLVTSFTSLAYEAVLRAAETRQAGEAGAWEGSRLQAWQLAHGRLSAEQRQTELGQWMIRSTDGGVTWSARYPSIVNSPHGPVQLSGGRLLYAGRELWTGEHRVGVCESSDDGRTWQWLAEIPARNGDSAKNYHELHLAEANGGVLVIHIRNENKEQDGETLQSESQDGGKTWSEPHTIGVWGIPSYLMRLRDRRLLMTYGYRRAPFGVQARVSSNNGRSWSEPLIIAGDGAGTDLGYPSTVELPDGALLTIWYEVRKGSPKAVLRQARWTFE